MPNEYGDLLASVQDKIEADTDFQSTLVDLSDEDKNQQVNEKTEELLASEIAKLKTEAGKAIKAQELADNYKIRAEKAEKKTPKNAETETPKNDMSLKDIRALQDVSDEDVDDVIEYAKFKGISVAEAKKSTVIQTLLNTKKEERATASATSTNTTRRSNKETAESIVNEAHSGKLPETTEGIQKLVEAELALKREEAKRGNR